MIFQASHNNITNSPNSFFDLGSTRHFESLLAHGIRAGADFVEIFLENTNNISSLAEQDTITSVNPSFGRGAGIRVFSGLKDGFVSTNDLTQTGLLKSLNQALAMLGLEALSIETSNFIGLDKIKDFGVKKVSWQSQLPSLDEINSKLLSASELINKYGHKVQVRRCSYSRSLQEVLVVASDGTYSKDIRLHQTVGVNLLSSDKDNISNVGRRYGTSDDPDDIRKWDAENSIRDLCESGGKMLYADYVEASQKPVILANKFGGVIFHEACGHLLETTQLERGTSPFSNKLNQQIANKCVTAIDEGNTKGAFGSISMDDEGMNPQRTVLIEKGILKNFISDRAGELRTGNKRTGSGRRQSHSYAPASRMRNTYIASGSYSPQQLIESIDDGLYCKAMGGGSVGPTGQFNFAVEEGYIIKNGKLMKPVKGATLIGEAKEILPRISMCANDLDLAAGFCGSVSGNINVTVGQPHIKVDSITIGGR